MDLKPEPKISGQKWKIGMILSDAITDISWNGPAYGALMEIAKNFGCDVSFKESVPPEEASEEIRDYAIRGFDIIFAHGGQYAASVIEVAKEFTTKFFVAITVKSIENAPKNVGIVLVDFRQISYLAGMIAGYLTKTNKLGYISPFSIPDIEKWKECFLMGAKRINPMAELDYAVAHTFTDVSRAKDLALEMINNGADFVYGQGHGPTLGAIKACDETRRALTFGSQADMHSVAPEVVVTSLVWNASLIYKAVAGSIINMGKIKPAYYYGIAEGGVYLAPFYNFEDRIPQRLKKMLNEARGDIIDGRIKLPKGPGVLMTEKLLKSKIP
ncbi:MAG: hypothetical protein APU95_06225 [Hadesarchaea archaeon YNP_N21]|nr:MAG: hypothetical protein APU95_06225 [Hadesarchaea archaeon YNP_N21]